MGTYAPKWRKTLRKKTTKTTLKSCGRRGKPPAFISSVNYKTSSSPGAGRTPSPQPPLKKEGEGLITIIITIMVTTTPAWRQEGKKLITPPITTIIITTIIITTIIITTIIITTIIITPALPLRGKPPISQYLQLALP